MRTEVHLGALRRVEAHAAFGVGAASQSVVEAGPNVPIDVHAGDRLVFVVDDQHFDRPAGCDRDGHRDVLIRNAYGHPARRAGGVRHQLVGTLGQVRKHETALVVGLPPELGAVVLLCHRAVGAARGAIRVRPHEHDLGARNGVAVRRHDASADCVARADLECPDVEVLGSLRRIQIEQSATEAVRGDDHGVGHLRVQAGHDEGTVAARFPRARATCVVRAAGTGTRRRGHVPAEPACRPACARRHASRPPGEGARSHHPRAARSLPRRRTLRRAR